MDLHKLKQLAQSVISEEQEIRRSNYANIVTARNEFCAAALPETVLKLIERIEQLEAENDDLRKYAARYLWLRDDATAADWEMLGFQLQEHTDSALDALMESSK